MRTPALLLRAGGLATALAVLTAVLPASKQHAAEND